MFNNIYFVPMLTMVITLVMLFVIRIIVIMILKKSLGGVPEFKAVKGFINIAFLGILLLTLGIGFFANICRVTINAIPEAAPDRSRIQQQQRARDMAFRKEAEEL